MEFYTDFKTSIKLRRKRISFFSYIMSLVKKYPITSRRNKMSTIQIDYWRNVEQARHNVATEKLQKYATDVQKYATDVQANTATTVASMNNANQRYLQEDSQDYAVWGAIASIAGAVLVAMI